MQNCVNEIRRLVPPGSCNHCSGKENQADLPSRGEFLRAIREFLMVKWIRVAAYPSWSSARMRENMPTPEECVTEEKNSLMTAQGSDPHIGQVMNNSNFKQWHRDSLPLQRQ